MKKERQKRHILLRVILGMASAFLYILALPGVRNLIWKKGIRKGKEKVIDAKARIVDDGGKDGGRKKDGGILD